MHRRAVVLDNCQREEMRRIFFMEMNWLLLPAYLVTASHELAAGCFLEAWEMCQCRPLAIGQSPRCAAKAAVVKAAVRKIAGDIDDSASAGNSDISAGARAPRNQRPMDLNAEVFRQTLLSMDALHRAVLVLRLYEGYSSKEAAFLMQISRSTVESGWQQALLCLLGD